MLVYKFGGSSIKDPGGIKNLSGIVSSYRGQLIIVISALGKTTNALEELVRIAWDKEKGLNESFTKIKSFHFSILDELVQEHKENIIKKLNSLFLEMEFLLKSKPGDDFDRFYDQIVSKGELWASLIIEAYLNSNGIDIQWLDARKMIITDETFRSGKIDWKKTTGKVKNAITFKNKRVYLTQGFIGGTKNNLSTTLGREGSDFTAAILGYILDAKQVVIWKDVRGILNADPKYLSHPVLLPEISYQEAIELAYFGAKVLHPKTIKPLQNKSIPLIIRSFIYPESSGTIIRKNKLQKENIPSFIFKKNQLLISIYPRDFSFAVDDSLGHIFSILNRHKISVNLIQNSAISISACVNYDARKLDLLIVDLRKDYIVYYNKGVELVTIRHYNPEAIKKVVKGEVLIEQKTRATVHFVIRS